MAIQHACPEGRDRGGATAGTLQTATAGNRWNATVDERCAAGLTETDHTAKPTRTWLTQQEYLCRYHALRDRAAEVGVGHDDHLGFAEWVVVERARMRPAYWRKVRQAALAGLDLSGAASARQAERMIRDAPPPPSLSTPRRAPRAKGIKQNDLAKLLRKLSEQAKTSRIARVLICWLIAGHATGLRPVEWRDAELLQSPSGDPLLKVRNAKATNGRAHGATRTLNLGHLLPQQLDAASELLKAIQIEGVTGFRRLHASCSDLLYKVNRLIWPRRKAIIGLYSARHQYAANAKCARSAAEVAALMGHASSRTAYVHYARRSRAELTFGPDGEPCLPVPAPEEVCRVRVSRRSPPMQPPRMAQHDCGDGG
ncbi:hypothetical protein [Falsiroseomonas oryzae]|uniref:hypothetical protein n=1 Tax=Falsiroseomonas oryzae TaxID=2766473 RepID=UPI0022EABA45|nr:hypothetical protein [Roseomonas sp. MO-31]